MNMASSKQEFDWCGGKRKGGERGERKRKNNTALKKKINGSPEIETCGVNEMAKESIKCEQKEVQRMYTFADGMKSAGPVQIKKNNRMIM